MDSYDDDINEEDLRKNSGLPLSDDSDSSIYSDDSEDPDEPDEYDLDEDLGEEEGLSY